jgi:hypothetical protein
MNSIGFLIMLTRISGFSLFLHLGMIVAWLLGGCDREGYLNSWGMLVTFPFLLIGYLWMVVFIMALIAVPIVIIFFTPLCIFIFDNSCIDDLRRLFW